MSADLVRDLGYANLDTRLKRISDKMSHSLRAMYRDLDIETEPNWYLVYQIVEEQPKVSVMEIAHRLRFTHQSVMAMTQKMITKGFLESIKDPDDRRRTLFKLTEKSREHLNLYKRIWEIGKTVTLELLNNDTAIMQHLDALEANLEEASFGERIKQLLKASNP